MMIWRARDAYRVQTWWIALCLFCFGLPLFFAGGMGAWGRALQIAVGWWVVQWGFPRLIRLVVRGVEEGARGAGRWSGTQVRRWWQGLGVVLVLGSLLTLSGCMDAALWWSKTQGIAFDKTGHACQATLLRDGQCQPMGQEAAKP